MHQTSIETVQIDWFTFGAQIVNFLILVGLLKRFLYGPILDAMDRREAEIAARMEKARMKEEAAEQEAERYRSMQAAFESRRAERMQEVEEDVDARRHQLIAHAREDVEYLERQWREAIEREQAAFLHTVSERTAKETIALARRVLDDLAGAELEAQTITVFLDRLRDPGGTLAEELSEALKDDGADVTLRSAFELPEEQAAQVRSALQKQADHEIHVSTIVDSGLGLGIEVQVGNRTIAWTLDQYLEHLLQDVLRRLQADLEERSAAGIPTTETVVS